MLKFVNRKVRDKIRLELQCGCRPDEIVSLRPSDVNREGDVWEYIPPSHKSEHRGCERRIYFGPRALAILNPWLENRPSEVHCFSPAGADVERRATQSAARRTPVQPSHAPLRTLQIDASRGNGIRSWGIRGDCYGEPRRNASEPGLPVFCGWIRLSSLRIGLTGSTGGIYRFPKLIAEYRHISRVGTTDRVSESTLIPHAQEIGMSMARQALRLASLAILLIPHLAEAQTEYLAPELPSEEIRAAEEADRPVPLDGSPVPLDGTRADDPPDLDSLLDIADQDLGQLSQVQVSSPQTPSVAPAFDTVVSTVERKESTVGRTPAAVFVITPEMIRRSGARSIPEVLRMAPGVHVARIDANKWAISIRGFNNRFANKLLIQIDGRSVYTPLFGGTFWDVQDVLLEDVERIEVVRGPGGTVWGENAVNGVINVITKSAADTQGQFVEAGGGSEQRAYMSARQGGRIGQNGHYRAYAKWHERDNFVSPMLSAADDSRMKRAGARMDWDWGPDDHTTIQGDFYDGYSGTGNIFAAPLPPFFAPRNFDERVSGANLLYRRTHTFNEDSDWRFQTYYDYTDRDFQGLGAAYEKHTLDFDFQHRFRLWDDHELLWGAAYRIYYDEFAAQPFFLSLTPANRTYDRVSAFVQDTMTLVDEHLYLTLGSKFSHNDFTGFEVQPSARLLWTPTGRFSAWGSISKAVRTAVRVNEDSRLVLPPAVPPVYPVIFGRTGLEAENMLSYEFGVRQQPADFFSWDFAAFYSKYEDLIGVSTPTGLGFGPEGLISPLSFINGGRAETYGCEIASTLDLTDRWSVRGAYSFVRMDAEGPSTVAPGDSPRNQAYLQSSHDLWDNWQLDLIGRYVDNLPTQGVPAYITADVRLGWQPSDWLELYVVGRNLLDRSHPEFGSDTFAGTRATEVQRGVYGGLSLRF